MINNNTRSSNGCEELFQSSIISFSTYSRESEEAVEVERSLLADVSFLSLRLMISEWFARFLWASGLFEEYMLPQQGLKSPQNDYPLRKGQHGAETNVVKLEDPRCGWICSENCRAEFPSHPQLTSWNGAFRELDQFNFEDEAYPVES